MTPRDHERWADAAGAYVLEAMPGDEREAFERHLEGCATCREEVEELLPAARALPMASPPVAPPAALKTRIMAEVEREAALLAQVGPAADRPPARRWRAPAWLSGWRLAPVAAALLVAGVLAGTAIDREGGGAVRTVAMTVDPERAPGATARLRVGEEDAVLIAEGLPAPPGGRVYQVWVMPQGSDTPEPTNALFLPRTDGSVAAAIPGAADAKMVLVTDEPRGGADVPSRTPLMSAAPS